MFKCNVLSSIISRSSKYVFDVLESHLLTGLFGYFCFDVPTDDLIVFYLFVVVFVVPEIEY